MPEHRIGEDKVTVGTLKGIAKGELEVALSETSKENVEKCRNYLLSKLEGDPDPIYGINTGFGALCDTSISKVDLDQLQENLVLSHACGTGDPIPDEVVRLMLVLKVIGLSKGYSGVAHGTIERLLLFYEWDILPEVPEEGSLGASGDLAPLAHLSLPLIGRGKVKYKGKVQPALMVLKKLGLEPLNLGPKEGLALLNGTQFMSAVGAWCVVKLNNLSQSADTIASLSLDVFDGLLFPFHQGIHKVRPHAGQGVVAENVRTNLEGSELAQNKKEHVQDPYSFRCIPQVHGACRDILANVQEKVLTEIDSVTDNPTVFPEEDRIISAGNFHGQPLAMAFDQLALAIAEWGSISERRTYKLMSGQRGLPEFLIAEPGLNSGLMILQYTAASLVSKNKQAATPTSVDSIDSSNGQEDHVSMGANGAIRCLRMIGSLETILGIEWMSAAQGLDLKRPSRTSPYLEERIAHYREQVPFVDKDTAFHPLIDRSAEFISYMREY